MDQAGHDTAEQVVDGETLRTPDVLELHPEHPQGEHVEEEVHKAAVQELIRDQLPRHEAVVERLEGEPSDDDFIEWNASYRHAEQEHAREEEDSDVREQEEANEGREEGEAAAWRHDVGSLLDVVCGSADPCVACAVAPCVDA